MTNIKHACLFRGSGSGSGSGCSLALAAAAPAARAAAAAARAAARPHVVAPEALALRHSSPCG